MQIVQATLQDRDKILTIFDSAKKFMVAIGNPNQWTDGYPSLEIVENDINSGHCYKVLDDNNEIQAVFTFFIGDDPTYAVIEDGAWLDNSAYGVIHRIASTGKIKKISDICIDFCFNKCKHLRVDTHRDNTVMQNAFLRNGFVRTGIIYVRDHKERIAYEKI